VSRQPLRNYDAAVNFRWLGTTFVKALVPLSFALWWLDVYGFPPRLDGLFEDAVLYWEATRAWVSGGDPWTVVHDGVVFAGWPPTLLLNLPLLPFGPDAAKVIWPLTGIIAAGLLVRRLRLPIWWLFCPVIMEGWLPGSPDITLAGLVLIGGGAIAALTKPYSVPALLAERRWQSIAIAGVLGVASLLVLPWGQFFSEFSTISANLAAQSHYLSLANVPVLIPVGVVAIGLHPRQTGISLVTPLFWPSPQLHYAVFSLRAVASTPILAIGFALPLSYSPVLAIIISGAWLAIRRILQRSRRDARAGTLAG
jgi:hypothetical protein